MTPRPTTEVLKKPAAELRTLGYRVRIFGGKKNPMDFDSSCRPQRTLGMCYMQGRSVYGTEPWIWVEYPDNTDAGQAILDVAHHHGVRMITFAAPATEHDV